MLMLARASFKVWELRGSVLLSLTVESVVFFRVVRKPCRSSPVRVRSSSEWRVWNPEVISSAWLAAESLFIVHVTAGGPFKGAVQTL